MSIKNLKGETLKSVILSPDRDFITFTLLSGSRVFRTIGECCSQTWIEHLEVPLNIEGVIIFDVKSDPTREFNENGNKYIKVYRTTIVTNRGLIDIEYRNSSNGYYGGSLEPMNE